MKKIMKPLIFVFLFLLVSSIIYIHEAYALGLIWSGVSKSGSTIGDLGDVADGCINGQYLKRQSSNSTWICDTLLSSGFTAIRNTTTGSAFPISSNSSNTAIFKSFTDSTYITWTNAVGTLTATLGAIPESMVTNLTTDLSAKQNISEKAQSNGYASLNSNTLVPSAQLGTGANSSANFLRGDRTFSSSLVTSITGTANNLTASASTGAVTLNLGSNVVTTGLSAQTITKTLTLNSATLGGQINFNGQTILNTGTITLPTATTTLVGTTETNTITGAKTMSGQNVLKTSNTGLIIRNPATTFATTIAGGAVTANQTLNTPAITGTDTLPAIGFAQTWTALQTFGTATTVGKLAVAGATSGSTIINASAVAGSSFVTLPRSGTLFSGTIATVNQTQASLPTTDKLVFTIPMTVSKSNIVDGIIFAKSSVAGTAVNMAFNLTAVAGGNHGTCHVQAPSTATADLVANVKLPTVLTGRAISTAFTAWITASDPAPINFQCTVTMGSTAANLKVWINPEVTGATISADAPSSYRLIPPT